MHGDPRIRQLEEDRNGAEDRLQPEKDDCGPDERDCAAIVAVAREGPRCERGERQTGDDREEPVQPLDARRDVERREELPMAERPVRAAQTGAGHAHDAAPERGGQRDQEGEIHEAAI